MKHNEIDYVTVPRETYHKVDKIIDINQNALETYLEQLLWWNKRINLVSRDVPRGTIKEHIRHSLLLTQLNVYSKSAYIVDTGTGGGLPGLPLAIVSQKKEFLLNDIVSKKALALKQMVRKLGLQNVKINDSSISDLQVDTPCVLISKHAFKIPDLINYAVNLPWSSMIFYKGSDLKNEIAGINIPLNIKIYNLYENNEEAFYEGKFIVELSKK